MALIDFTAHDLFGWLIEKEDFLLLDVRNDVEFGRFKVESPFPFKMINIPYMEFLEHESESIAKVPVGNKIRIVCAKEGSAKYVGEILSNNGFDDVGYLQQGIKSWGNMLAPVRINGNGAYALYQFIRPGKASCSYALVVADEMMVFDPAKNIDAYRHFADQHNAAIIKTVETHRQADYISGSLPLHRTVGAQIAAPQADFDVARFDFAPVRDGETLGFSHDGPEVRVIHTPGHTPGSTCYLIDNKFLITGDTVFIESIGRPDLGGKVEAWSKLLFDTMRQKILPLPAETLILPGHYIDWREANADLIFMDRLDTITRRNAAIYKIDNEEAFLSFIKANMRSQPEEYAQIREINAGLEEPDMEKQDILDLGKNECAASAMAHT